MIVMHLMPTVIRRRNSISSDLENLQRCRVSTVQDGWWLASTGRVDLLPTAPSLRPSVARFEGHAPPRPSVDRSIELGQSEYFHIDHYRSSIHWRPVDRLQTTHRHACTMPTVARPLLDLCRPMQQLRMGLTKFCYDGCLQNSSRPKSSFYFMPFMRCAISKRQLQKIRYVNILINTFDYVFAFAIRIVLQ